MFPRELKEHLKSGVLLCFHRTESERSFSMFQFDLQLFCDNGQKDSNANAAAVTNQQTQTTQQIIAQQGTLANAILADAGNVTPNVPTPAGIPTVQSVTGESSIVLPTENSAQGEQGIDAAIAELWAGGQETENNITSNQSQENDAISGSQASTNAAINDASNSAAAGITASANGSNLGLGSQVSQMPVDPVTDTTTTASGGNMLLPILLLGGGGFALWMFVKHEHKAAA